MSFEYELSRNPSTSEKLVHILYPYPGLQSASIFGGFTSQGVRSQELKIDGLPAHVRQPALSPQLAHNHANLSQTHGPQNEPRAHVPSIMDNHQSCRQSQVHSHTDTASSSTSSQPVPLSQLETVNVPAVTRKEADWKPWRYRGYPAFCKWMASDDDFFVVRRFGSVSARVALYLQDQIALLEEELGDQDRRCRQEPGDDVEDGIDDGGTFRFDHWTRRGQILAALATSLERYQRFILDHSMLKARPNASASQVKNVTQWLENAKNPIEAQEVAYLEQQEDLIPVVSKERAPLRRLVDKVNLQRLVPYVRDRKINMSRYDAGDFELETTVYTKDALIDKLVTCFTMLLGIGMLIGPLWWLQYLSNHGAKVQVRLGVITAFLVLFAILISILAVAKPFEVLAATAAYGAVLMVYMQLGSNS